MTDPALATLSGPELFARYAAPPNLLGYCGPEDTLLLHHLLEEPSPNGDDLIHAATLFDGAYPYLELIAGTNGHEPLDAEVVAAYWTGNRLLEGIDTLLWGNGLDDRFRSRAGGDWDAVAHSIIAGGVPNHAFHVFCVYPWVGLLRTGATTPALHVLDRCRIAWGEVVEAGEREAVVRSPRLRWVDGWLELSPPEVDRFAVPPGTGGLAAGDIVSLHWEAVCERLNPHRLATLRRYHNLHLAIANEKLNDVVAQNPLR
jgi:hypothetical protein